MRVPGKWFPRLVSALALLAALPAAGADQAFSVEAPRSTKATRAETFHLAKGAKSPVRIDLGEADAGEIEAVRRANAEQFTKYLQVGIGRRAPSQSAAKSQSLRWERVPGGVAAQWVITSSGAKALRVMLEVSRLSPAAEMRFSGSGDGKTVYGPYSVADLPVGDSNYWSPVLEGERATVEIFVADSGSPDDVSLAIGWISHFFVSPADSNAERLAKNSGPCQIDVICVSDTDAAIASLARSVARMTLSDGVGGGSGFCTGTLLTTTAGPVAPYFYTAAHCTSTQASANTVATHWFYDRTGCGTGGISPNYVQVAGGTTLLYANTTTDVTLLRLNQSPPAGALYAGWNANTLAFGTGLLAVHHPAGDTKKVSVGSMGGFSLYGGGSGDTHVITLWPSTTTGVVEGGSSGSGIFTPTGPASTYQLRGGLHGGPSSCTATGADLRDYYSRFDRAYQFIAQYLNPAVTNYTALWWNPAESGWGVNFNQQGNILFGTLFTYDATGAPLWLVMPSGAMQADGVTFTGDLYRTTGPAFNANPFTPIGAANLTRVGTMTASFANVNTGTLSYTVNGVAVGKAIERQVYGTRAANCSPTSASRAGSTNYQDLWWNAAESGWGINITHQDSTLFATLFTYDASGRDLWLVMSSGTRQSDGSYQGELYRTAGPAFNTVPFTGVSVATVGAMRLDFSDGNNGTLTYTYNGAPVTKVITRQEFSSPLPACS